MLGHLPGDRPIDRDRDHDHLDHRRQRREPDQGRIPSIDADQERVAGREHGLHRVDAHLFVDLLDRQQCEAAEQNGNRDQRREGMREVIVRCGGHRQAQPFAR